MNTFGQNGEERIAKILNEATKGLNAHGLSPLGPHKDVINPSTTSSLALPISQVIFSLSHTFHTHTSYMTFPYQLHDS